MHKFLSVIETLLTFLQQALDALFNYQDEQKRPWLRWGWLALLYAAGGFAWGKFLNWGRIPFDFHDWAEVWAPRIHVVRVALLKGIFPFHMADMTALRGITDRFFAIPDIMFSPQMVLLRFMEAGPFLLVNTLLLYTLGAWGLLWLRRKYKLSLFSFSFLFLLFNLNGHITTHFSVGHPSWSGYFLLPWFIVLVVQLLEGDRSWGWVTKMALLLFAIYIQGSFHPYIWCLLFLGFLGLASWKENLLPVIKAGAAAVLLSLVRILPPVLHYREFDSEFLGGYTSLYDVWAALVKLVPPQESLDYRGMLTNLGWWELDIYLGFIGAVFLLYGMYRWFSSRTEDRFLPQLLLPVGVMLVLSIGRVYRLMRLLPVPILSGERVSSRMIALPVIILLFIAAVELQKQLDRSRLQGALPVQVLGLSGLLLVLHDLWQHIKLWQVSNAFTAFPNTPRDLSLVDIANHPDPQYTTMLAVGAAISLLTLVGLLVLARRKS